MKPGELAGNIQSKKSFLCVGLDSDLAKIPPHLHSFEDPILEFNLRIIEATAPYAVAYKPNLAFYESLGPSGWITLQKTLAAIPRGIFTIADAKRGDIGNTASMYAHAFFETYGFDSVTVAPYMGHDSVKPFLQYKDKWVFLLALTSNPGAEDFQWTKENDTPLYKNVIRKSLQWAKDAPGHLGFVAGATREEYLAEIRHEAPESFFLVPGVGAQGGSLQDVYKNGANSSTGLLVNSSRGIIYASNGKDFAEKAGEAAKELQGEMEMLLNQ